MKSRCTRIERPVLELGEVELDSAMPTALTKRYRYQMALGRPHSVALDTSDTDANPNVDGAVCVIRSKRDIAGSSRKMIETGSA